MKKASCVLIIVLLLLLEISAKAEWVSIVELRQQVDEMGRWIQNYIKRQNTALYGWKKYRRMFLARSWRCGKR